MLSLQDIDNIVLNGGVVVDVGGRSGHRRWSSS
jgi:hypothetical protein